MFLKNDTGTANLPVIHGLIIFLPEHNNFRPALPNQPLTGINRRMNRTPRIQQLSDGMSQATARKSGTAHGSKWPERQEAGHRPFMRSDSPMRLKN